LKIDEFPIVELDVFDRLTIFIMVVDVNNWSGLTVSDLRLIALLYQCAEDLRFVILEGSCFDAH
jgi:hypothetical protein